MTLRRLGAWAGILGPTLFVAVFSVEGALRRGYAPGRMYISALSFGPRGWIQIVNFVVLGVLFLVFAGGVAAQFREEKAPRLGPVLLAVILPGW